MRRTDHLLLQLLLMNACAILNAILYLGLFDMEMLFRVAV
jgi:hypothetical protein